MLVYAYINNCKGINLKYQLFFATLIEKISYATIICIYVFNIFQAYIGFSFNLKK